MAIERIEVALIRCDWCGVPGPHSPSSAAAVAEAHAVGWESVHEVHVCPVCLERGAAAEAPPEVIAAPMPSLTRFALTD